MSMKSDEQKRGKAYLVGAGPGDAGLLTIKGMKLLSQADVVIYDRLASPRILSYAPRNAEFIYVGKTAGRHAVSQDEINHLIVSKAQENKMVVRLKGGDPFIFGRGGEEAQVLAQAGIPFEIVPGVSSSIAAPAYAGIPLTHRAHAACVTLITGHRKFGVDEIDVNWEGLAKSNGTLVFLMGMTNLPNIVSQLTQHGLSAQTPAAVVQWGTTARQKTVTGVLSDIVQRVKDAGLTSPAVIVVGTVVGLRETIQWFEKRPLFGRRILVTRSREQASELVELLEEKGAECIELPAISVVPVQDVQTTERIVSAFCGESKVQWVVFTSVNAVRCFFELCFANGLDMRAFGGVRFAVIGSGTANALSAYHLKPDLIPTTFDAEGLVEAFKALGVQNQHILIPKAEKTRDVLVNGLKALGARVEPVTVYENVMPDLAEDVLEALSQKVDVVTFTSSSTVKNLSALLPSHVKERLISHTKAACIGPVTGQTARAMGFDVAIQPDTATISALVKAIEEFFCPKG